MQFTGVKQTFAHCTSFKLLQQFNRRLSKNKIFAAVHCIILYPFIQLQKNAFTLPVILNYTVNVMLLSKPLQQEQTEIYWYHTYSILTNNRHNGRK